MSVLIKLFIASTRTHPITNTGETSSTFIRISTIIDGKSMGGKMKESTDKPFLSQEKRK